MKTRPGPCLRLLAAALACFLAVFAGGCASKTGRSSRVLRSPPPVAGADEILRRQQVAARARELIASGKYKTTSDARNAAEREFPAGGEGWSAWSAEYAQWEKQKVAREKFEADFAKANRQP